MLIVLRVVTSPSAPPGMRHRLLEADPELFREFVDAVERNELTASGLTVISRACRHSWYIHKGQLRKTGEPYIVHPDAMVRKTVSMGIYDPALIVLEYLHDGFEDRPRRTMPGYEVNKTLSVWWLTHEYGEYGPVVIPDLRVLTHGKKQNKWDYLWAIPKKASWRGKLAKLFDRWHNLKTLYARSRESQQREVEMTLRVFPAIVASLLEGERAAPEMYHEAIADLWEEMVMLCQTYPR